MMYRASSHSMKPVALTTTVDSINSHSEPMNSAPPREPIIALHRFRIEPLPCVHSCGCVVNLCTVYSRKFFWTKISSQLCIIEIVLVSAGLLSLPAEWPSRPLQDNLPVRVCMCTSVCAHMCMTNAILVTACKFYTAK